MDRETTFFSVCSIYVLWVKNEHKLTYNTIYNLTYNLTIPNPFRISLRGKANFMAGKSI